MRGRVNGLAGGGFALVTAATFLLSGAVADLATPAVAVTAAGRGGAGPGRRRAPELAARRAAPHRRAGLPAIEGP